MVQIGRGPGRIVASVVERNGDAPGELDVAWVGSLKLVETRCDRAAKVRYRRHRRVVVRRVRCAALRVD